MRTLSTGRANKRRRSGVTLIEMLVVLTIASLIVAISFPSVSSGLDTLRLNGASNDIVAFMNSALSHAERRRQVIEVTVSRSENMLRMRSADAAFTRKLVLPDGIAITRIFPELPDDVNLPRVFMLYPGGAVPPFGVALINRRQVERLVQVDPMTGVAVLSRPGS